jgi:hypothetical protein
LLRGAAQRLEAPLECAELLGFHAIGPHRQQCRPEHHHAEAERDHVVADAGIDRVGHVGGAQLHAVRFFVDALATPAGELRRIGLVRRHVTGTRGAASGRAQEHGDLHGSAQGEDHDGAAAASNYGSA